MNNIVYIDNDPTKPVIYIGVILFFSQDKKIKYLLLENNLSKYEDIGLGFGDFDLNINDDFNSSENLSNNNNNNNYINQIIKKSLSYHTNYLIDMNIFDLEKSYSKQVYIPSEMSIIKFISVPDEFKFLKSEDFGLYTVKSNDVKIKRRIKWIERSYLLRTLSRFNKLSKKLNTKEMLDAFKSVESENTLNNVLKTIRKKIIVN
jgi:hypothetical protein